MKINTYIHTYIHTYISTCIEKYIQTYIKYNNLNTYIKIYTYMDTKYVNTIKYVRA